MELVAVKFIPIDPTSSDTKKLQREIDIMKKIPHCPEVVRRLLLISLSEPTTFSPCQVTYHGCYVKDDMLVCLFVTFIAASAF